MSANPYAQALAGRDPMQVLNATPQHLERALTSLTAEQIDARPAPGKWSLREILAHLADCELAFGFRLRQAYGGERMVQPFDQDAWSRAYGAYPADQALSTFKTLRAWNMAFLGNLTEADMSLPVMHPERGAMTLWTIAETMAGHDSHHLARLG